MPHMDMSAQSGAPDDAGYWLTATTWWPHEWSSFRRPTDLRLARWFGPRSYAGQWGWRLFLHVDGLGKWVAMPPEEDSVNGVELPEGSPSHLRVSNGSLSGTILPTAAFVAGLVALCLGISSAISDTIQAHVPAPGAFIFFGGMAVLWSGPFLFLFARRVDLGTDGTVEFRSSWGTRRCHLSEIRSIGATLSSPNATDPVIFRTPSGRAPVIRQLSGIGDLIGAVRIENPAVELRGPAARLRHQTTF
jgi:hypothetical protein